MHAPASGGAAPLPPAVLAGGAAGLAWEAAARAQDLSGTAIVTMASGDENGMLALALVQSLRDAGTRVPTLLVMLMRGGIGSADCSDPEWKAKRGRQDVRCHSETTIAAEIVSEYILAELARLGAEVEVHDPIPPTEFTAGIPGGTQTFWGMALNKLKVFGLTRFRKVVWMDSDDYVVRNVDHLLAMPPLTGSLVTACCHAIGPAYPGGGIWVLEPSESMYAFIMDALSKPRPGGTIDIWCAAAAPPPLPRRRRCMLARCQRPLPARPPRPAAPPCRNLGDMQIIRHLFGASPTTDATEPLYPAINDLRHGYVGGLRYFAAHRDKTDAEFAAYINSVLDPRKPRVEGLDPTAYAPGHTNWMALDMRYDQCVGSFKCSPERDDPDVVFSVHFSCLQGISKPSQFPSEEAFMTAVNAADDHSRYWFLRWYATYVRATRGVGLPAPKYAGPPVPGFNATHSEIQDVLRLTAPQL